MKKKRARLHTPFPWNIYKGGNFVRIGGPGYAEQVEKTHYLGGAVCEMDNWDGEKHSAICGGRGRAKALANAKLIIRALKKAGYQ